MAELAPAMANININKSDAKNPCKPVIKVQDPFFVKGFTVNFTDYVEFAFLVIGYVPQGYKVYFFKATCPMHMEVPYQKHSLRPLATR